MAEKKILDPDEFMAKEGAIEDPDAFMAATGAAPSTLAAPPPEAPPGLLGLTGNFLGGHGGKGGLVSDLARGVMGIPHMLTSPFEWSRGVAQQSIDQFKESENKGRPFVGSLMTAIPLIGPAATKTGEQIGTGDPRDIAAGLGSTVAQILPFGGGELLAKGIGKIPTVPRATASTLGEAVESGLGKSVEKSYARSLNAPSEKLAGTAINSAPALAGLDLTGLTAEGFAQSLAAKAKAAGKAVDDIVVKKYGQTPIDKDAILQRIEAQKAPHINPTTGEPFNAESAKAVDALEEMKNDVDRNLPEGTATVADLARYRRVIDKQVTQGRKSYADAAALQKNLYKSEVADILRDSLNGVSPEIAQANKNFSDLTGAQAVAEEALQKKQRQAVMPTSARGGGLNVLAKKVSGLMDAVTLRNSTAWNTLSAVAKKSILESLKNGEMTQAAENVVLTANLAAQRPKKATYFPDLAKAVAPLPPPPVLPPVGVLQ